MSKQVPQTLKNHVQLDPPFHFFLAPGGLLLLIWAIVHVIRHPSSEWAFLAALALLLVMLALKARVYSLKVQDRIIRLEERLRLASLLDASSCARIGELTESQLIALRFASDAEAPELAAQALKEKLDRKAIKTAIRHWRADYFRV
jgi:Family of unknown function (DUF6526)